MKFNYLKLNAHLHKHSALQIFSNLINIFWWWMIPADIYVQRKYQIRSENRVRYLLSSTSFRFLAYTVFFRSCFINFLYNKTTKAHVVTIIFVRISTSSVIIFLYNFLSKFYLHQHPVHLTIVLRNLYP